MNMKFFFMFILTILIQRLVELKIARGNENLLKKEGAMEYGQRHYYVMITMHCLFFVSLIFEVVKFGKQRSVIWPMIFSLFLLLQLCRIWVLRTLGKFWNTKILVLPGAQVILNGPYRFVRHPNYLIVSLEIFLIPLLFNAYATAIVFTILNLLILSIRIPAEEKALLKNTNYYELLK